MANEKEALHNMDVYMKTVDRLEPDISMIDAGAFYASAAISLKRIADTAERLEAKLAMKEVVDTTPAPVTEEQEVDAFREWWSKIFTRKVTITSYDLARDAWFARAGRS